MATPIISFPKGALSNLGVTNSTREVQTSIIRITSNDATADDPIRPEQLGTLFNNSTDPAKPDAFGTDSVFIVNPTTNTIYIGRTVEGGAGGRGSWLQIATHYNDTGWTYDFYVPTSATTGGSGMQAADGANWVSGLEIDGVNYGGWNATGGRMITRGFHEVPLVRTGAIVDWRDCKLTVKNGGSGDSRFVLQGNNTTENYIDLEIQGGRFAGRGMVDTSNGELINTFNNGNFYVNIALDRTLSEMNLKVLDGGYLRGVAGFDGFDTLTQLGDGDELFDGSTLVREKASRTRMFVAQPGTFAMGDPYTPVAFQGTRGLNAIYNAPTYEFYLDQGSGTARFNMNLNGFVNRFACGAVDGGTVLIDASREGTFRIQTPTLNPVSYGELLFYQDSVSNFDSNSASLLGVTRGVDSNIVGTGITPTRVAMDADGIVDLPSLPVLRQKKRGGISDTYQNPDHPAFVYRLYPRPQHQNGVTGSSAFPNDSGQSSIYIPTAWYSYFALGRQIQFLTPITLLTDVGGELFTDGTPIRGQLVSPQETNITSEYRIASYTVTAADVSAGGFFTPTVPEDFTNGESTRLAATTDSTFTTIVHRNGDAASFNTNNYAIDGNGRFSQAGSFTLTAGDYFTIEQHAIPAEASTLDDVFDMIYLYCVENALELPFTTEGGIINMGTGRLVLSPTQTGNITVSAGTWTLRAPNPVMAGETFRGIESTGTFNLSTLAPGQGISLRATTINVDITGDTIDGFTLNGNGAIANTIVNHNNVIWQSGTVTWTGGPNAAGAILNTFTGSTNYSNTTYSGTGFFEYGPIGLDPAVLPTGMAPANWIAQQPPELQSTFVEFDLTQLPTGARWALFNGFPSTSSRIDSGVISSTSFLRYTSRLTADGGDETVDGNTYESVSTVSGINTTIGNWVVGVGHATFGTTFFPFTSVATTLRDDVDNAVTNQFQPLTSSMPDQSAAVNQTTPVHSGFTVQPATAVDGSNRIRIIVDDSGIGDAVDEPSVNRAFAEMRQNNINYLTQAFRIAGLTLTANIPQSWDVMQLEGRTFVGLRGPSDTADLTTSSYILENQAGEETQVLPGVQDYDETLTPRASAQLGLDVVTEGHDTNNPDVIVYPRSNLVNQAQLDNIGGVSPTQLSTIRNQIAVDMESIPFRKRVRGLTAQERTDNQR